jgi:hypothetical protein
LTALAFVNIFPSGKGAVPMAQPGEDRRMTEEEMLQLAFVRIAGAARLLAMAGEELLAEEAEALAEKVDLAQAAARP